MRTYLVMLILLVSVGMLLDNFNSEYVLSTEINPEISDFSELDAIDLPQIKSFTGFVENIGQNSNPDIKYYFMTTGSYIAFGESVIYVGKQLDDSSMWTESEMIGMIFENANDVQPVGLLENDVTNSFYTATGHYSEVAAYNEVWYYNLYNHIDLRYYHSGDKLKYEFIVHPGGDTGDISIRVDGLADLYISYDSIFVTPRNMKQTPLFGETDLFIYQNDKTQVFGKFTSTGSSSYGFEIGAYDQSQDLIIDPLVISQSTYINGNADDYDQKIDYSSTGYYIAMRSTSTDFPTNAGVYDTTSNGGDDIVILDMSYNGEILRVTYFGGSSTDYLSNIASGVAGYVCVVGSTWSSDFPTTLDADDSTLGGTRDGFLACFNYITSLSYSTYIGGSSDDAAQDVALSYYENTNITVTGWTYSSDFTTTTGVYSESISGSRDAYTMKFMSESLLWSTYYGGTGAESASGIGMDLTGNVFFGGWTDSDTDLPLSNEFQSTYAGGTYDMFVAGLNTDGTSLLYSSYYGGTSLDNVYDGHVDPDGNLYLTGSASASLPTTTNAFQSSMAGVSDGFVAKISPSGVLSTSTYIGGTNIEYSNAIYVGNTANSDIFIAGETRSTDFPVTSGAYQTSLNGTADAFYARISSDGTTLVNSTYFGGSAYEGATGIYGSTIVGVTTSSDLPLERPYATTKSSTGIYESFIATFRYVVADNTPPSVSSPADISYLLGTSGNDIYWSISDAHPDDLYFEIDGVHVTEGLISEYITWSNGIIAFSVDGLSWGDHTATIIVDDQIGNEARDTVNVNVYENVNPTIDSPSDVAYNEGSTGNTISWTVGDAHPDTYFYTIDSLPQTGGSWSGTSLQLNIDGLVKGTHTLVLTIQDVDGNTASDTVSITVNDVTSPVINSPSDFNYNEDSTGNTITWTVSDLHPYQYELYIDEKSSGTGSWTSGTLQINVDGLLYGSHNITLVIYDDSGNWVQDQVDVNVIDITKPDLQPNSDISYKEGTIGNEISWTIGDRHPGQYYLYLDEVEISTGSWINGTFTWNVDGFTVGTYEFGLAIYDTDGNVNSNSIFVTVIDASVPNLTHPSDVTIIEGSTGNIISWDVNDLNPDVYNITLDGVLVQPDTSWSNGTISYNIDDLAWGEYKFIIYIFDTDGNMNFDELDVTVIEDVIPDISMPNDMEIDIISTGNILSWTVGDGHPSLFQILVDGEIADSGSWVNGSIDFSIDSLSWGTHEIIITIYDLDINSQSDTVTVTVYETTVPDINSPGNFEIVEGTGTISWNVGDQHPDTYEILVDDTLAESGSWTNGTINFSTSDLLWGDHTVVITIEDKDGNSQSDTVMVNIYETIIPDISSPADVETYEGTGSITWNVGDQHPGVYNLYIDTTLDEAASWTNGTISLDLSRFSVGSYIVRLVVFDVDENIAEDSVNVVILPELISSSSTSSTSQSSDASNGGGSPALDFNWTLLFLTLPIVAYIRRKKV